MANPYYDAGMQKDGQGYPVQGLYPFMAKKTVTFAGGTTDAWGDDGGALDGGVLFTVTGAVKCVLIGVCTTNLVGGATLEVGITGATAIFMPQTTDTAIDAGELWLNNATPATYYIVGESEAAADNLPVYMLNGNDIILTVSGGANTTSGVIDFYCYFTPISSDGNVVDSGL